MGAPKIQFSFTRNKWLLVEGGGYKGLHFRGARFVRCEWELSHTMGDESQGRKKSPFDKLAFRIFPPKNLTTAYSGAVEVQSTKKKAVLEFRRKALRDGVECRIIS